jgi:transposase
VKRIDKRLAVLVDESGSTLTEMVGIGTVTAAELLVEVNDPSRLATSRSSRGGAGSPASRCPRARATTNLSGTASTCSATVR